MRLWLFLLSFFLGGLVRGITPSLSNNKGVATARHPSLSKNVTTTTTSSISGSSTVAFGREVPIKNATTVQLVETEVYDGKIWQAPGGTSKSTSFRWTDTEGEIAPSPDQWKGRNWTSDWKIVTSVRTDEFGWEYEYKTRLPIRRRIWLRTYQESDIMLQQRRKSKRGVVRQFIQILLDDFNFKGFGVTFYKSLVFMKSAGVALRLPLVTNFNTWESHPSLPNFAPSFAYYTPGTFVLFLNASVRYEWIKWVLSNSTSTAAYVVAWLVWTLLIRGLITAISAILFPVTRKLWLNPELPLNMPDWRIPPAFSRVVEERLGCSWSWRVSIERGYEYRVSYWHYFAPTVVGLLRGWKSIPAFLVRHAAALGLSTSGPIADEPYLTSSALFALSGFYFSSGRSTATPATMTMTTEIENEHQGEDMDGLTNPTLASSNAADLLSDSPLTL